MARRDEIEAALAASFDREHLAVYADVLQSEGDPRGELIAIDLHGEPGPDVARRRRELVEGLLGPQLSLDDPPFARFELGFLELVLERKNLDHQKLLLAGELGEYLRRVQIQGVASYIEAAVTMLVARSRPWLQVIQVRHDGFRDALHGAGGTTHDVHGVRTPIIGEGLSAALVAATPRLDVLVVTREPNRLAPQRPMFSRFEHPNVSKLQL